MNTPQLLGAWLRDELYRRGYPSNALAVEWGWAPGDVRKWFRNPDPELLTPEQLRVLSAGLRMDPNNLVAILRGAQPRLAA